MTGKAVRRAAPCKVHGKSCPITPGAKQEWAGLICTDWSTEGKQMKEHGKTAKHYAAWVALRRMLQEPQVVVENVPGFNIEILEAALEMYAIMPELICPTTYGCPGKRLRAWIFLLHRLTILSVWGAYANTTDLWTRTFVGTFHEIMIATEEELLAELEWAINKKPKSRPTEVKSGYRFL
jgi:hypothetical protein